MIQENKELLLKDLCCRLPYGIKAQCENEVVCIKSYMGDTVYVEFDEASMIVDRTLEEVKPYLFPMSSMTEKQKNELESLRHIKGNTSYKYHASCVDFYNSNHLDYRELIEKGLAIDATNLGIYE